MTLVFADRVKESTTSTGTGPLTLGGAESGFRAFSSVCVDGDTAYYCVTDGTSWEVGLGTFAAGVLSRTTVLSSSSGGALVALNPGPKDVFLTVPASVVAALQALETQAVAAPPTTPGTAVGQLYFDESDAMLAYSWDGAAWNILQAQDLYVRGQLAGTIQSQLNDLASRQFIQDTGAPSGVLGGQLYWDQTGHHLYIYDTNAAAWVLAF